MMNKMWTCYASGTRWALNHAVATVALEHDLTTILDFPEKCIWSIICVILSTYHIVKLATLSSLYMSIVAINGKLGNINSECFYRLEKLNLRRTLGERKMSDFPSGVWERGKSKGWNWVFRLLGIFWMWILPESATGTSKRFAPKINSVRFFIVNENLYKHTSLAHFGNPHLNAMYLSLYWLVLKHLWCFWPTGNGTTLSNVLLKCFSRSGMTSLSAFWQQRQQ